MKNAIIHISEAVVLLRRESGRLDRLNLDPDWVLKVAFGFAMATLSTGRGVLGVSPVPDILSLVASQLNEGLPYEGQSLYGRRSAVVHEVVDLVGEISHILVDAVIHQLGHVAADTKLIRLIGPDLMIQINEETLCPSMLSPKDQQSMRL